MSLTILEFAVGPNFFGLPIAQVQEVVRIVEITHLPDSPPFVEGVINLRGSVIPVLDLRKRFGAPPEPYDMRNRILIVPLHGRPAGLIADEVHQVAEIPDADLGIDPSEALGMDLHYVSRVLKAEGRLLALLDVEKVLSPEEGEQMHSAAAS